MNSRPYINSCVNNSLAIRQEIQRFESVHPSIYAIYDLIELISDPIVAQQIRDHVVCIEDSFVNSQEWTVSRCVPDLRLGIVGSLSSGKSALVHRYLTGSYMQEESPEGGRFKKEVHMDGHSHLLLIRDEGGPPELQFTSWVDAVIFVFSLENEASFTAIYNYYAKMSSFRNSSEIPLILVGTQDAISASCPRVIDDARARKLAIDLNGCNYYETCATYGHNVERVFQDACQKIVQRKIAMGFVLPGANSLSSAPSVSSHLLSAPLSASPQHSIKDGSLRTMDILIDKVNVDNNSKMEPPLLDNLTLDTPGLPTPTSTPTTSRKNRRRSNLFTPSKKISSVVDEKNSGVGSGSKVACSEVGSGRAIPIKQGYLYKRSSKTLNKEWKKKYVTLTDDGRITYHPSLHDYMTDVHGKEIPLRKVTVKVPGQKPRGTKTITQTNGTLEAISSITNYQSKDKKCADKVTLTSYEVLKEAGRNARGYDDSSVGLNASFLNGYDPKSDTPSVKKRHRRMKSNSVKNQDNEDADGYEFHIVSLDNKQWHFQANSYGEREEWLTAIENQILNSLQGLESTKGKLRLHSSLEAASLSSIRSEISGNNLCADCSEPNPDWASLNLGILLCIECSGIHRNLGSHISKVRSLHLDEWPPSHLAVMLSIGNQMANSIWECEVRETKPGPASPREEKERWTYIKYQAKQMLRQTKADASHWHHQIIDSTCREDIRGVVEALVHGPPEVVNATVSPTDPRTPLFLACSLGNLPLAQLLLWYNADLAVQDSDGQTVLSVAKSAAKSQPDSSLATNLVDLLTTLIPAEEPQKPIALDSLPTSVI